MERVVGVAEKMTILFLTAWAHVWYDVSRCAFAHRKRLGKLLRRFENGHEGK
jgi:hypothetical protein